MKSLINLALVITILFFASCEGNTEYLLNVKNNSTETIRLVPNIDFSYTNIDDTINIAVGETKEIARWSQMGGNQQSVDITGSITSIYATKANNKVLDSSVCNTFSRWVEVIEEKKKVPSNIWHHYELSLNDNDFK